MEQPDSIRYSYQQLYIASNRLMTVDHRLSAGASEQTEMKKAGLVKDCSTEVGDLRREGI